MIGSHGVSERGGKKRMDKEDEEEKWRGGEQGQGRRVISIEIRHIAKSKNEHDW